MAALRWRRATPATSRPGRPCRYMTRPSIQRRCSSRPQAVKAIRAYWAPQRMAAATPAPEARAGKAGEQAPAKPAGPQRPFRRSYSACVKGVKSNIFHMILAFSIAPYQAYATHVTVRGPSAFRTASRSRRSRECAGPSLRLNKYRSAFRRSCRKRPASPVLRARGAALGRTAGHDDHRLLELPCGSPIVRWACAMPARAPGPTLGRGRAGRSGAPGQSERGCRRVTQAAIS
jgi:hypothetical protein